MGVRKAGLTRSWRSQVREHERQKGDRRRLTDEPLLAAFFPSLLPSHKPGLAQVPDRSPVEQEMEMSQFSRERAQAWWRSGKQVPLVRAEGTSEFVTGKAAGPGATQKNVELTPGRFFKTHRLKMYLLFNFYFDTN